MNTATATIEEKVWNAAIYTRISKEDGDKEESDSISNQKNLIKDFIKSMPNISIITEMADDGFSGGDFLRPAFTQMIEDIKAKRINCVIVKDGNRFLSRQGKKV